MGKQNNPELVSFANFMLNKHGVTVPVTAEDLEAWANQPVEAAAEQPAEPNNDSSNDPEVTESGEQTQAPAETGALAE